MPTYFDFEVSLSEIELRIWRRFHIHSEAIFMNLHYAIQQAFGWQDCHLYEFLDGKVEENDTRPFNAVKLHYAIREARRCPP